MLYFYCMARADIRVRVRPSVIRVRIAETGIRTVFSVSTPKTQLSFSSAYHLHLSAFKASLAYSKEAWKMDYQNLVALDSRFQYFNELLLFSHKLSSGHYGQFAIIGKARAERRVRARPSDIRVRIAEPGMRTAVSVSTPKAQLTGIVPIEVVTPVISASCSKLRSYDIEEISENHPGYISTCGESSKLPVVS